MAFLNLQRILCFLWIYLVSPQVVASGGYCHLRALFAAPENHQYRNHHRQQHERLHALIIPRRFLTLLPQTTQDRLRTGQWVDSDLDCYRSAIEVAKEATALISAETLREQNFCQIAVRWLITGPLMIDFGLWRYVHPQSDPHPNDWNTRSPLTDTYRELSQDFLDGIRCSTPALLEY